MGLISEISTVTRPRAPTSAALQARHRSTYRVQLAVTPKTRRDAYQLRHDSYVNGGYLEPQPDGLFRDGYDDKPNAHTIVIYESATPIASVRVCFLSQGDDSALPVQSMFPSLVHALVDTLPGKNGTFGAAEVNRLVRCPHKVNDNGLVFFLYKVAGYLMVLNDVRLILSCARKNHVTFYRRLKFQEVSGPMVYPGLNCPMHLLALPRDDYDTVRASLSPLDPDSVPQQAFAGFAEGRPINLPSIAR